MSRINPAELAEWARFRDQLIARRDELRNELATIEAALSGHVTPKSRVRRVRRSVSTTAARVEEYLRAHPGETARTIATAIGVEAGQATNALLSLLRRKFVVRYRNDRQPWQWTLASGVNPAPPPLSNNSEAPEAT